MIRFGRIRPDLFVGSCIRSDIDVAYLKNRVKVTGIINLQTDEDLAGLGLNFNELNRFYIDNDLVIQRYPIRDFDSAELAARLGGAVEVLDGMIKLDHRVYLHCTAGLNRSATVAVAWLVQCGGMTLTEAAGQVTTSHACAPVTEALELWHGCR